MQKRVMVSKVIECCTKVKEDIHFPPYIFTHTYMTIVEQIFAEFRPHQIAINLKISDQNLNYYLSKLLKDGILIKGERYFYRELHINPKISEQLKEEISSFKSNKDNCLSSFNTHHISILYPIIKDNNEDLKNKRDRWKSKLTEEVVKYNGLFYRVEKSSTNIIIRFPKELGITYVGFNDIALDTCHHTCFSLASIILQQVVSKFKEPIELGNPSIKAHYAKKDDLAHKYTAQGITFTYSNEKISVSIDKSPHFSPRGELETNDEKRAEAMLKMYMEYPSIKEQLNKLTAAVFKNNLSQE